MICSCPQGTNPPASKGKHKQQTNNKGGKQGRAKQGETKNKGQRQRQSKRKTRNTKAKENRNKAKSKEQGWVGGSGDDNCIYTRVKINARTHKIARVLQCKDQRTNYYKTTRVKHMPTFAKSQFVEEMHHKHACQALHSSTHAYMS